MTATAIAYFTVACAVIALICGELRYRLLARRHRHAKETLQRVVTERDVARWELSRR